ncbi:Conserved_hypothetical protein [Hexamita inflata]|uniref:Uncharacterized protein n=1 Tax=Hexamita inflata TaxID=28002 RepID=A0AA86U2M8_9EUKA|nr:Conserved hypothetical protein [Hexamita inflata]
MNKPIRPMSGKPNPQPVAATIKMQSDKDSGTIESTEEINVHILLQRIRNVNDQANKAVESLRGFNQSISESISNNAKSQILVLGEQVIEPRIKEQYKLASRLQVQIQHPESNQLSINKLNDRLTQLETKVNTEQVLKLKEDVQKIKDMLLRIVKVKKEK